MCCSSEQIVVRIPVRGGVDLAAVIADVASSFSRGCGSDTTAKARTARSAVRARACFMSMQEA